MVYIKQVPHRVNSPCAGHSFDGDSFFCSLFRFDYRFCGRLELVRDGPARGTRKYQRAAPTHANAKKWALCLDSPRPPLMSTHSFGTMCASRPPRLSAKRYDAHIWRPFLLWRQIFASFTLHSPTSIDSSANFLVPFAWCRGNSRDRRYAREVLRHGWLGSNPGPLVF